MAKQKQGNLEKTHEGELHRHDNIITVATEEDVKKLQQRAQVYVQHS